MKIKRLLLVSALCLAGTAGLYARGLKETIELVESMADVTVTDVPKEQMGEDAPYVKRANLIMPSDPAGVSGIDAMIAALPEETQWLDVNSPGTRLALYVEKADAPDTYYGLMKIESDGTSMYIALEATEALFSNIKLN